MCTQASSEKPLLFRNQHLSINRNQQALHKSRRKAHSRQLLLKYFLAPTHVLMSLTIMNIYFDKQIHKTKLNKQLLINNQSGSPK